MGAFVDFVPLCSEWLESIVGRVSKTSLLAQICVEFHSGLDAEF